MAQGNSQLNINLKKVNGTATDTNSGNKSAGTLRVTLATDQVQLTNALKVDGSAVTQPVSAASLPLPTGAATSAAQTDKSQFTKITDGTDTALVTAAGEINVLATAQPGVDIGDVTINNAAGASAVNIQDGGNTITVDGTVAATQSGTWNVTNVSGTVSLPTGASTLAEQQTQTTALQLIDDTITAQGTALGTTKTSLEGGSVTTAAPTYTTGQINPISLTTSGALRVDLGATSANATAVKVDGSAVTQPISGTVTATQSTATNLKAQVIGSKTNNSAPPSSDNLGVFPAFATSLVQSWTDGNMVGLNTDLTGRLRTDATSWLGSTAPTVGSKTSANSVPVVIASDQGAVAISAASLPLPALAATSTKQSDGSQKTQIVDGAGAVIDAISGGGYDNLLVGMGATNYIVSTVNSTAAQLGEQATFTGTIETVFNQQSYSILLVSDQNGTLTLNQYIDLAGTQLISTIPISILARVPFARSGVLNGNYFNLTYKNVGTGTTTTLKLDTAYGTIPSASQLNNGPTSLNEVNGTAITLGTKVATASIPVTVASDQPEINTNDNRVNQLLERILTQITAQNEEKGIFEGSGNSRVLNGNRLEIVAVANHRDKIRTANLTLSASVAETVLIPNNENVYNDILAIVVINTSTATNTRVDIRDNLGGAVIIPLMSIGGSSPVGFSLGGVALPQSTRGATWTAQCATSTTDVRILAIYSVN